MSGDSRLPITVKAIAGGVLIQLADGGRLYVHGLEPEIARVANTMTKEQAEELAMAVAQALTEAWGDLTRDDFDLGRAMGAELERAMGVDPSLSKASDREMLS
jgi:hypothetical protein